MENTSKGHPKGLYLLYFTEMWERFSYYGMRAIFTLYMLKALLFDKAFASQIYGSYTGLVYLTPLLGGYIADKYWGNRKSIIFGGILMAIGQFFMFLSGSMYTSPDSATMVMFTGLGFLIFGNGFFKPNISTMVGQLYREGDSRVDSAFTIFYQGINLGALLAPLVCGSLGEVTDASGNIIPQYFKYGFLAACIGMVISLVAFIMLKNKYVVTPDGQAVGMPPQQAYNRQQEKTESAPINPLKIFLGFVGLVAFYLLFNKMLEFDAIGAIIFSSCIVLPALIITDKSLTPIEKQRIWVIYIIAFFVIFFWSAFEQAGASLTFFAEEQTDRVIFGWTMPSSLFQIFNAAFIVILAPVAVSVWSFLAARGKEPASPIKQSLGLAFLSLGYLYIAMGVDGVQPWEKVSMIWLVGLYLIHTVGELCLSPIGLSMVVKLAPTRFVSLLMGVWFMSTATANKFAGDLSALYPEEVKKEMTLDATASLCAEVAGYKVSNEEFKKSPREVVQVPVAILNYNEKDANGVSLSAGKTLPVSVYHLKLIRSANSKFDNALISEDGTKIFSSRDEKTLDIWNLSPTKPSFLGMQVNNLKDFFMIFVYMSGAAALILFLISGRLLKMMHGVK